MPGGDRPGSRPRRAHRHYQAWPRGGQPRAGRRVRRETVAARPRNGPLAGRRGRARRRGARDRGAEVNVPLLDTHAWVWWVDRDRRLARRVIEYLDTLPSDERPMIADISLWEVACWSSAGGSPSR